MGLSVEEAVNCIRSTPGLSEILDIIQGLASWPGGLESIEELELKLHYEADKVDGAKLGHEISCPSLEDLTVGDWEDRWQALGLELRTSHLSMQHAFCKYLKGVRSVKHRVYLAPNVWGEVNEAYDALFQSFDAIDREFKGARGQYRNANYQKNSIRKVISRIESITAIAAVVVAEFGPLAIPLSGSAIEGAGLGVT